MGTVERKLREREARRELILRSALQVISEQGIRQATVDQIAERAELGKGTIYYYFTSKEAILESLLEASLDQYFHGVLAQIARAASLAEMAQAVVEQALRNHMANPPLFRFYFMLLADPSGAELLGRFSQRHLTRMRELRRAIAARWGLSATRSRQLADFLGTYVHGALALAVSGRDARQVGREAIAALAALLSEVGSQEESIGQTTAGAQPTLSSHSSKGG